MIERRMRRFALLFLLTSCGGAPPGPTANGAAAPEPGAPDNRIDCRPRGEAAFARACSVETVDGDGGRVLTIRNANGGFRRLRVVGDGSGVVAADGAEQARVTMLPDRRIEVEIGGDRFRLPARVRGR